jgi:hypothetical protein
MRALAPALLSLILGLGFLSAQPLRAENPPDPLRYISDRDTLFVRIDNPREAVTTLLHLPVLEPLRNLEGVKEALDSTNVRQLRQFITYLEGKMGYSWPELLDRIAGGGVVAALTLDPMPPTGLVVIQGTDEELTKQFWALAKKAIAEELARQNANEKIEEAKYRTIAILRVGKDLQAARVGAAFLISNSRSRLERALDLQLDGKASLAANPKIGEARKLMSGKPLVWAWLNLDRVRQIPQAKQLFAPIRDNANQTFLAGGLLDVARRAPFLGIGLYADADGVRATLGMPCGREGMPKELALHVSPRSQAGALPVLEPEGVLSSISFYLDLAVIWNDRKSIFSPAQVKALEDADKKSAPFLLGNRLSQLMNQCGTHVRAAVVNRPASDFPNENSEAYLHLGYALVIDSRNPAFCKTVEALARGAALLAQTQVKLRMLQEKEGSATIIGYVPADNALINADRQLASFRFLPSPCFARVGDQVVLCSSMELGHAMVKYLAGEKPIQKADDAASPSTRVRFHGKGVHALGLANEDRLYVQFMLNQALTPDAAHAEVHKLLAWLGELGNLDLCVRYGEKDFRIDMQLSTPGSSHGARKAP